MNWMHSACLPQAPLHVTPKIGYVDLSVIRSRHTSYHFTSGHINGDTHTLFQIPYTKLHGDFKHIPHTSSNTRCHHIPLSHFVSNTNKPKHHESCSTKSKPYSKLQIKNFRCCVVKEKFRNSFVLPKI